jgi:hypothetical protein
MNGSRGRQPLDYRFGHCITGALPQKTIFLSRWINRTSNNRKRQRYVFMRWADRQSADCTYGGHRRRARDLSPESRTIAFPQFDRSSRPEMVDGIHCTHRPGSIFIYNPVHSIPSATDFQIYTPRLSITDLKG